MEKTNKTFNTFLFISFVGANTIITTKEKYSLISLDDTGTCIIPNCFIRTSKAGKKYISLPKSFKTEYRLTSYNRDTKERKLLESKEVTAWDIKKLLAKTNKEVKDADNDEPVNDELPF